VETKIQVISDVHTEFHKDWGDCFIENLDASDVDVLVVAGDLGNLDQIKYNLIAFCKKYKEVIYVPGNHDFYGTNFFEFRKYMSTIKCNNLHFLDNKTTKINDVKFIGTTMWFRNSEYNNIYKKYMNDFREIRDFEKCIYEENSKAIKFLNSEAEEGCVVITHHLPTGNSIHRNYWNSPLNIFFMCDMEELIVTKSPKVWIHGHTHFSFDYYFLDTRIVCNPFGYVNELNPEFEDKKIVAV